MAEPTEPAVESAPETPPTVAEPSAAAADDPIAAPAQTVPAEATAVAAPVVSDVPQGEPTAAVEEHVGRGILMSLLVIPAGVVAWTVIWNLGFMSAIVAFGVAVGGAWLYRRGSGGRMGTVGVVSSIVVTLVTLVLAFLAGLVTDLVAFLEIDLWTAITSPEFWDLYFLNVFDNPALWEEMTGDILFALLFAALGAFSVFWNLAKAAKAEKAAKQAGTA